LWPSARRPYFTPSYRARFELASDVDYRLRDAKHGRINIADRAMQRLTDAMVLKEETAGWAPIVAAATADRTVTGAAASGLCKQYVDGAFKLMELTRERKVTDIYVGPGFMADIRGWTQNTIDPVTQREIFVNAGLMSIYGAQIHVVHFLDANEAYFLDQTPNQLGYMPIRDELRTFDNPVVVPKFRVGIIAYEEVGFVVMDKTCIVKVALS
jgi:methylmalonyl-CoA mutase cobalamin-binding subunit